MKYQGIEVVGWKKVTFCDKCGEPGRTCRPHEIEHNWPGIRPVLAIRDDHWIVKHHLCQGCHELYIREGAERHGS